MRDRYRCVLCGKKGKLHCHHIVPIKISHDNSMSNLVSVCESCHKKLETIGFTILEHGGSTADVRRAELKIINEAQQKRLLKYLEKNDLKRKEGKTYE